MAQMGEYNAADESQVKKREQSAKTQKEQEIEDIKNILKLPAGVRFFKRLLNAGHMFQTSFTGNSQTFFKEGERNLMLRFFDDICEASPDKLTELLINKKEEDE